MENQNQFVDPVNGIPPPPTVFNEKPKMKIWKKLLLVLLGLVLLIVVGIYNIPRIMTILYPNDAELADNSSLILQKVSIPDSDNGFFDLNQITEEMLKIPKNSAGVSLVTEYTDYTKSVQWDQKLVDQVLKDNEKALSLFDMASSKNNFQIPDFADPANINIDTKLPKMNIWRTVAQLQAIKAISLLKNGKPDDAVQEALKLNKLGHNIILGQGPIIGTLVGVAIKTVGSKTILQVLPSSNFKKGTLENALLVLNNSSDDIEGYRKAFKSEYIIVINGIDQIKDNLHEAVKEVDPTYARYANFGYYFKINQTKNLFTDLYVVPISTFGVKCEVDDSISKKFRSDLEKLAGWRVVFAENAVGRIISSVNMGDIGGLVTKQCQTDFLSNATQIQLALKKYKTDKKVLPASLNELVPTYLSSIPVDPFDQKPIRYSESKKILYSVGLKQKDLGGSTGSDYATMDNPTVKIEF